MRFLVYLCVAMLMTGVSHAVPIVDDRARHIERIQEAERDAWAASDPRFDPVIEAIQQGDLTLAHQRLAELGEEEEYRRHPGTLELLGTIKLVEGDTEGAEVALRRASNLAPDQTMILAKLGMALLAQSRVAEAETEFRAALALDGSNVLARRLLGDLAAERGDMQAAIDHYRRGMPGDGRFSAVHTKLADLLLAAGEPGAVETLLEPVADKTDDPEPYLLLARARVAKGDASGARAALSRAERRGANAEQVALYTAVIDRQQGDLVRSEERLRGLIASNSHNPFFFYELALTRAAQGDLEEARTLAIRAAGLVSVEHGLKVDAASTLSEAGDAYAALRILEPVLDAAPSPSAYVVATRAAVRSGDIEKATTLSGQMIAAYPDYLPAYQLRAQVLQAGSHYALARDVTERATTRFPQAPESWINRVGLLVEQQRFGDAERVLGDARKQHPDNLMLEFQLATVTQHQGRPAEAETIYRRLLEHDPYRLPSLNNLAMLLVEAPDRREEALRYAEQAYRLAPDIASVEDTLGWVLLKNRKVDRALARLRSAYAKAPDDLVIVCHLGMAYAEHGDVSSARSKLEHCVHVSPDASLRGEARRVLNALAS